VIHHQLSQARCRVKLVGRLIMRTLILLGQLQSIATTKQLETSRSLYRLQHPTSIILVESSIRRIGWQYAGSHQENVNDSKALMMTTR